MAKKSKSHMGSSKSGNGKADIYAIVTDNIIKALENGTAPWRKPWKSARNLVSGKEYRGYNAMVLGWSDYESPYWLTFKQALDLGGHVREGETSTAVVFWKWWVDGEKNAETGEVEPLPDGKRHCTSFYHRVFNLEQCEGIPSVAIPEVVKLEGSIYDCKRIVDGFVGCPPIHHKGSIACYVPLRDCVEMPSKTKFEDLVAYYSTLFHELVHSTGHRSRLARFENTFNLPKFGSEDYSKEELIAEFGAAMLCGMVNIHSRQDQSASYIASWLKVLKDNRAMLIEAAQAAQKAADHILGAEFKPVTAEKRPEKQAEAITVSQPLAGIVLADLSLPQLPDRTTVHSYGPRHMWYTDDNFGFANWGDYRRHLQDLAYAWDYDTSKNGHPLECYWGREHERRYTRHLRYEGRPARNVRYVNYHPNVIQLPAEVGGRFPMPWTWGSEYLMPDNTWSKAVSEAIHAVTVPQNLVDAHIKLQNELESMGWTAERRQNVGTMTWKREDHTVLKNPDAKTEKAQKTRREMDEDELAVSTPDESPDEYIAAVKTAAQNIGLSASPKPKRAAKPKASPKPQPTAQRGILVKGPKGDTIKWDNDKPKPLSPAIAAYEANLDRVLTVGWGDSHTITATGDTKVYTVKGFPAGKDAYRKILTIAAQYGGSQGYMKPSDKNRVFITWKADHSAYLVVYHKNTNELDLTRNTSTIAKQTDLISESLTKWSEEALRLAVASKNTLDDAFPRHHCPVCGASYDGDGEHVCEDCRELVGERSASQYQADLIAEF